MRSQPCLAARPALQRSRCARVNALLLRSDERPLLSRPAPLRKGQSARIGSAPKLACQFEGLVTFRTWGHRSGKLQRRPLRDCPNQACQVSVVFLCSTRDSTYFGYAFFSSDCLPKLLDFREPSTMRFLLNNAPPMQLPGASSIA